MRATDIDVIRWDGCYDDSWRDLIVPAAFAHPAKMARGLVARIFDDLFARGALRRGSVVVDPFGGIGTTGIEAASRGVQAICCELEPKFFGLAQENFNLHARDWQAMERPRPRIVLGDSRKLRQHVGPVLAECVVSSPPYAKSDGHPSLGDIIDGSGDVLGRVTTGAKRGDDKYGATSGQIANLPEGEVDAVISSPPYAEIASGSGGLNTKPAKDGQQGGRSAASPSQDTDSRYGTGGGQLARMPRGDVDAIVSSPPFTQGYSGGGGINVKGYGADGKDKVGSRTYQGTGNDRVEGNLETLTLGDVDAVVSSPPWGEDATGHVGEKKWKSPDAFLMAGRGNGASDEARLRQLERDANKTYGDSDGQLSTMPMRPGADAVVSSPPYMGEQTKPSGIDRSKIVSGKTGGPNSQVAIDGYGETAGQLGGLRNDETFWSAALDIVRESFAILKPGGTAVWVVKHFVRDKQIVDFPGDWRKLCEHVGFVTDTEVHAMLVAEETKSHLFDGEVTKVRARKSFFRRLAEKKGSPPIDWETVLIMRKPGEPL